MVEKNKLILRNVRYISVLIHVQFRPPLRFYLIFALKHAWATFCHWGPKCAFGT